MIQNDRSPETSYQISTGDSTADPVLTIRHLKWAYSEGRLVLDIPSLDIPRGKMVMIVGQSGCGKTTLLEMLGLMNHPVPEPTEILFYPGQNRSPVDYRHLWNDPEALTEFRRRYLSFIFQQTRFLPSFSVDENIGLTRMIRDGVSVGDAVRSARKQMQALGIQDKAGALTPHQLSGGEQQRAAFIRAVSSNYQILFGDEPTGNLGDVESRYVLDTIRREIENSSGNKTAVIVTHNLELALQYADVLVILPGSGPLRHVYMPDRINGENIWPNLDRATLTDTIYARGHQFFKPVIDRGDSRHFLTFMRDRVGAVLFSLRDAGSWFLLLAMVLGLLSIGIMRGGSGYLQSKLRNPFIRSLEINLSDAQKGEVETYRHALLEPATAARFAVDTVTAYTDFPLKIVSLRGSRDVNARTMHPDDPVLEIIESPENLIFGSGFVRPYDTSVLVTARFLMENGYQPDADFLEWDFFNDDTYTIKLPIRGIFHALPGDHAIITTPYFYQQLLKIDDNPFHPRNARHDLLLYCDVDRPGMSSFIEAIRIFLETSPRFNSKLRHITQPLPYTESHRQGYYAAFSFDPVLTWQEKEALFDSILSVRGLASFNPVLVYEPIFPDEPIDLDYYRLSVFFASMGSWSSLKNLTSFQSYVSDTFGLNAGMNQIESLRSISFISLLTKVMAHAGMLVIIASTALLVYLMMYIYLYKMRGSIGQLLAFGADNTEIKEIFLAVFVRRFFVFVLISITCSILAGEVYDRSLQAFFEQRYDYYNPVTLYTLAFFAILFISGMAAIRIAIRNILSNKPGELVYERGE